MIYSIRPMLFLERLVRRMGHQGALGLTVIAMTLCVVGCDDKSCQFESDCPSGKACMAGECVRLCTESEQCSAGNVCTEGRCLPMEPDPECDGGVCPDTGTEADAMSGMAEDSGLFAFGDAETRDDLDLGTTEPPKMDDASVIQRLDSGLNASDLGFEPQGDGGIVTRGFDLTGLYTVASTVIVSTGGDFEEAQEIRNIVALTRLNGTRYRIESYNLDGVREYLVPNVDFVAPEGAGRFQYEYTRRIPYRLNCDLVEVRFERGRYAAAPHGFQLEGSEERTYALDGENCTPSEYLVRTESIWVPLP